MSYYGDNDIPCNGAFQKCFGHYKCWVIEINSLEELHEFIDENGPIVISKGNVDGLHEIEIYDDYRE
jgi:hypothetical protein